jgi:F0F1-type ATP synthase membrane subunit a
MKIGKKKLGFIFLLMSIVFFVFCINYLSLYRPSLFTGEPDPDYFYWAREIIGWRSPYEKLFTIFLVLGIVSLILGIVMIIWEKKELKNAYKSLDEAN